MEQQSYSNHRRYVTGFHIILLLLLFIVFILAVINMTRLICDGCGDWLYFGLMPLLVSVSLLLMFWYIRQFPLTVQDRVIVTEETLRHFMLTGKQLDTRLTQSQVIALRFAPDEEFLLLAKQAADENMKPDDIKKAIKKWKADHYRA
jgi:hypothetical protein